MSNNLITKSVIDKCNYDTFELPNKLKVFLIEDPETDVACATMTVKIGHSHDTIIGIAHFLEHMLFNGTEKYPDENEYSKYISKNGGSQNAYTAHDHTCYFFTVQPDCLEQSLDMFGDFFTAPLLNSDSIDREKNAVNEEHIKNITSDGWRLQEIMRHAMDSSNPMKKFGTGSEKTLAIPDIDKHVRNFFLTHYSSHLMTLFVVTKNNVQTIKNHIIDIYSKIPHRVTKENSQFFGNKIYNYPQQIEVVPLNQTEQIKLSWDLPSYKECSLRCPYHFLSHIIGHEGKNTIHHMLFQMGYITSLSAGTSINCNDRCTFDIDVTMTPLGANHVDDVVLTIIEYINIIKNKINSEHMKNLYDELLTIDAFEFKYPRKLNPMTRTMSFAKLVNTYDFDLKDLLIIPFAREDFTDPVKQNLLTALNDMTLDKCVVLRVSKDFANKTSFVDEDYGTNFNITNTPYQIKNSTIDIHLLDLPNLNKFISTDEEKVSGDNDVPTKLDFENKFINLYTLETNRFSTPDVNIDAIIDLPLSMTTASSFVNAQLYFSSILAEINHETYMCGTANYAVSLGFVNGKFKFGVFGNCGKILSVCKYFIESLLNPSLITQKIFETSLYELTTNTSNAIMDSPYKRVFSFFEKTMSLNYYNNYDIQKVLESGEITIDSVKNIINEIRNMLSINVLVAGNATQNLTYNLGNLFNTFVLNDKTEIPKVVHNYAIPTHNTKIVNVRNVENEFEKNSSVLYNVFIDKIIYGETDGWAKTICLSNILSSFISNDFFDQVRTKDSFGYVVNSYYILYGNNKHKSVYQRFLVQSSHKNTTEIINRIDEFIVDYEEDIKNISIDDFTDVINAMVSELTSPYNNIVEMASFVYNNEILNDIQEFNSKQILLDQYRKLTLTDLYGFYLSYFVANRTAIVIGLEGMKN